MQVQSPLVAAAAPALIPADPGKRVLAYLIDFAPVLIAFIPIIGALAFMAWMLCRDLAFNGQSLGKKAMGLKVVDATTGQTPTSGNMIIRNLVLFIPCFSLVELVVYFSSADKRRLGDKWTNTMVVPF